MRLNEKNRINIMRSRRVIFQTHRRRIPMSPLVQLKQLEPVVSARL